VLVAQDIAVAPMLVFAQSGADVFQQWPLLLVRIVIALLVLAGLLVWIGKTARQRLPLATLLGECRAGNIVQPGGLYAGGQPDRYHGAIAGFWCLLRRTCPQIPIYAKPYLTLFCRYNHYCWW